MTRPKRAGVTRWLLVALLLVGMVMALLWALQRQLVYFPDATGVPPAEVLVPGAQDVTLETSDGLELGAYYFPPSGPAETSMAVLFSPGNGGNRAGRTGIASTLR